MTGLREQIMGVPNFWQEIEDTHNLRGIYGCPHLGRLIFGKRGVDPSEGANQ
jgi:hypothetical protein